ncbi:translocation/assembly module TamB domain-containing protein [Candidatus Dependentiae bacterium]
MHYSKSNFFKILFIFLFFIISILWFIQNTQSVQNLIQDKIINILQKEWNAKISVGSSSINLFTGEMNLKNGFVKSYLSRDCKWSFDFAKVRFSRFNLFFLKKIVLKIILQNVKSKTRFKNNKFYILDHLKGIFLPSNNFDVDIKDIVINNLRLNIVYKQNNIEKSQNLLIDLSAKIDFKKVWNKNIQEEVWRGRLYLFDGNLINNQKNILRKLNGRVLFYALDSASQKLYLNSRLEFDFLNKHCFLNLKMDGGVKKIFLNLRRDDLVIKANPKECDLSITGTIPFNFIKEIDEIIGKKLDIKNNLDGYCFLDSCLTTSNILNGKVVIKSNLINLSGNGYLDCKKLNGYLTLHNSDDISLNNFESYLLNKKKFEVNLNLNNDFRLNGNYKVELQENISKKKQIFKGDLFFKNNYLKVCGSTKDANYLLEGSLCLPGFIKKFFYNQNGKRVINLNLKKDKKSRCLFGDIKYSFLKKLFPSIIKNKLLGPKAILCFKLNQHIKNNIFGSCWLDGGKLFVLGNYNYIKNINFILDINLFAKKIVFKKMGIGFLKGKVYIPELSLNLNSKNNLSYINCPIKVTDLLVNWKKDFYSLVCGNLLVSKKIISDNIHNSLLKVNGDLILKKTLLKGNLLSGNKDINFVENNFLPQTIFFVDKVVEFNINLSNQNPLKIKTDFFQVDANLDLKMHSYYFDNKIYMPDIEGNIFLENGYINFLRNKLYIKDGKVQFVPGQINNPMIDLIAKNKVKKYLINMQITGSLVQPRVLFESSPELREDEILALLMSGSESTSFQNELPVMLLQNLNDLISRERNIFGKTKGFFQKLTLPFKYVQITPNFSNQDTQGGVKGTLSIDFNKQMHALIQKNFNLQNDLAFQLEFFVTDNVNFKMLKDQSGELGAEVEVRLKL